LVVGANGARIALGATYSVPVFTPDGRHVAWRAMTGEGVIMEKESGRQARFGRLSDTRDHGSAVSADGRWLATQEGGGSGFVLDLGRAFAPPGADLCASPVRPFFGELREAYAVSLKGRPWNPCDWRGMAAVLPDAARGDGWFEGPRQWWRRQGVRLGLAPDYACGEINAAGRVAPARVAQCAKG
jgi:hypothetical protein